MIRLLSQTHRKGGNDSETAFTLLYQAILPQGSAVDALESALHHFCEHVSDVDLNDADDARHLSTLFDPVVSEAVRHLGSRVQSLEQLLEPFLREQRLYVYLKSVIEVTTRNTEKQRVNPLGGASTQHMHYRDGVTAGMTLPPRGWSNGLCIELLMWSGFSSPGGTRRRRPADLPYRTMLSVESADTTRLLIRTESIS